MSWMAWTPVTAAFFGVLALILVGMTTWEAVRPCLPRRGLLPLVTTRGDRLFIGLLAAAFINLAWVGLTELDQYYALGIGIVAVLLVEAFG